MAGRATTTDPQPVSPGARIAPLIRRARFWLVVGAVVVVGAALLTLTASAPGRPLDPDSSARPGSLALARLLQERGTVVDRTTSRRGIAAGATVLVAFPDSYRADQLQALAAGGRRLVLPATTFALGVLAPDLREDGIDDDARTVAPDCTDPAAASAGDVRFPAGTRVFAGAGCYGGRVYTSAALIAIGPSVQLDNEHLDDPGVAALAINLITDNGRVRAVTWLLPGADADGAGSPSVWQLVPGWTPRAVVWLVVLGLLVVLWRSRRMGPVVYEPLPVVVRAAEIVEGHGRLYRRAHARDRAAAALRSASRRRLARAHGVTAGYTVGDLVAVVGAHTGRPAVELYRMLDGPVPTDDTELAALAVQLAGLDSEPSTRESSETRATRDEGDDE